MDEIAQGRVWMGADALNIGLVDEIGTLEDAIAYAAMLADLHSSDEYKVVGYPQPLSFMEEMMIGLGKAPQNPGILSGTPFEALGKVVGELKAQEPGRVYARLPYALEIR